MTNRDIDAASDLLADLTASLEKATDLQWQRPPVFEDPADPGIRGRGGHPDPTGDTATDEDRLALREAVRQTERDSRVLHQALFRMESRLRRAMAPFVR